ncbi:hypothetical protein OO013_13675 [Mangrovivirga sp. M17]|uniref:Uncharacterized protein n=1 Tax=Mangrovivirga halotolerans TaxID=2993936 RepID=A0ABT3RTM7_9BACT|nr:hypothetical protein [Mangrovivirga halotolerans]MCX2744927.1 hypothetical protein [Mangrovivirga halotolerans]
MKKVLIFLIFILFITLGLSFGIIQHIHNENFNKEFDLILVGETKYIQKQGRYDIVGISIEKSNVNCFDSYKEYEVLYIRINNDKAEIILPSNHLSIGDKVYLNGKESYVLIQKPKDEEDIVIPIFSPLLINLTLDNSDFRITTDCQ